MCDPIFNQNTSTVATMTLIKLYFWGDYILVPRYKNAADDLKKLEVRQELVRKAEDIVAQRRGKWYRRDDSDDDPRPSKRHKTDEEADELESIICLLKSVSLKADDVPATATTEGEGEAVEGTIDSILKGPHGGIN